MKSSYFCGLKGFLCIKDIKKLYFKAFFGQKKKQRKILDIFDQIVG